MFHNSTPEVSIITPVYNKAKHCSECIESVLGQSFRNWEMLLVDDGSTDGSREILKNYAAKYSNKIFILQHPHNNNQGVSESRNLATRTASGEFLAYLDADDTWMPSKLEHDVRKMRDYPEAAAVICHSLYWWDDGSELARIDHLAPSNEGLYSPGELFQSCFMAGKTESPCPCAVTVRRSIIERMSGWDPTYTVAEDLKYFAELFYRFPVFVSQHCLAEYRRSRDSAWSLSQRDGSEAAAQKRLRQWLRDLNEQGENVL